MHIHDTLITLFLGKHPGSLSLSVWAQIVRVLRYQQCLARFGWRLEQLGLSADLPEFVKNHIKNAELIAQKQNFQVQYEAALLQRLLKPLSAHVLFLKGAAYSLSDNDTVGRGRTYSDIDLLVDKTSLPLIEQELCLYGFFAEDLDEYDQKYYREWSHEIPPLRHSNRGTVLDIHHNLLPIVTGRAPDISLFFKHIQTTAAGYTVFSPAAMFLHSTIHLILSEEIKHGFRDLTDLFLLLEQNQNNAFWQELLSLSVDSGFTTEFFLALRYIDKILGFAIPGEVTQKLAAYKPAGYKLTYLDFIFMRKLKPTHPCLANNSDLLADWLLLLRGHYLKMPIHILLKHLGRKIFLQFMAAALGSNFFDKKTENHSNK
jgi:hypothetical protein